MSFFYFVFSFTAREFADTIPLILKREKKQFGWDSALYVKSIVMSSSILVVRASQSTKVFLGDLVYFIFFYSGGGGVCTSFAGGLSDEMRRPFYLLLMQSFFRDMKTSTSRYGQRLKTRRKVQTNITARAS